MLVCGPDCSGNCSDPLSRWSPNGYSENVGNCCFVKPIGLDRNWPYRAAGKGEWEQRMAGTAAGGAAVRYQNRISSCRRVMALLLDFLDFDFLDFLFAAAEECADSCGERVGYR